MTKELNIGDFEIDPPSFCRDSTILKCSIWYLGESLLYIEELGIEIKDVRSFEEINVRSPGAIPQEYKFKTEINPKKKKYPLNSKPFIYRKNDLDKFKIEILSEGGYQYDLVIYVRYHDKKDGQPKILMGSLLTINFPIFDASRAIDLVRRKISLRDQHLKENFFPFLKLKELFIQEIGKEKYSNLQEKLTNLKEKCANGISTEDCVKCEKIPNKNCITKLFSNILGKKVLPHCGVELSDCYWISENEGYAVVIKGANMNTKNQYMEAFTQINDLTQRNTVKTIFFANSKSTSNQFLSQALNLCKSNKKQFIVFNEDDIIQFLYFYEKSN